MISREKVSKSFSAVLSCMIKLSKDSSKCEVRHRLDALRLFHDELSSLDSSMNISVRRLLGDERAGPNECA